MSNKRPATVADIPAFDALVDARSPAEYALDHIPGAINCPVLDDEERRIVGTLYKQQGAFEARRVGGAMVAANLARHLREHFADKPAKWKPLIYCWRGGMRSGSMVTWLRLVGWDAQQLGGGYKRWRQHVVELIDTRAPALQLRVVSGPTGSAKTRVLQALAALGEQVLDLEEYAAHKGSVLGDLPGVAQPSQKAFETRIAAALERFDPARTIFVEAESRKIGQLALPTALLTRLRESPCVEIEATREARLAYLLRDYAYLGDDRAALAGKLARLHGLQSNETLTRWIGWAEAGELTQLFAELMVLHYDPLYARSQATHLAGFASAERMAVGDLSEFGIEQLAHGILMRFGCGNAAA
ncbi:tRNA 2-selenouridine(34) synthase MnmH [Derxia lacustris]|uniref:tRNA 2-selenouridine(34) synthase MnmH n=1 Tax=Derxia lacustris TaxID=764842 RepID=UPI000A16D1FA|nr:tRNA 2-selenouridine(34) synthase MnmH [Derxia lacustris]